MNHNLKKGPSYYPHLGLGLDQGSYPNSVIG